MSVVSAQDIENSGDTLVLYKGDILTPLASDRARELGVSLVWRAQPPEPPAGAAVEAGLSLNAVRSAVETAAPTLLGAFPGSLYRRGAPVPRTMTAVSPRSIASESTNHDHAHSRPKVAVVGAGHVGATTALRLSETSLFSEATLIDIVPGLAEGLALDMWHGAGLRGFTTRINGSTELSALTGADYVVMTAGRPRQPGMSRTDLTGVNAEVVGSVAQGIRAHAPGAVVVVVTNPLEEMTHLMTQVTGFAPERVIGMAGVLDTARFCSLVALTGIAEPGEVSALALGSHGPEMVIPLSQATARGRPLESLLQEDQVSALVERARDSGAQIVGLLKKGSAYYSPAESAAFMVTAMATGNSDIIAACVQSGGAYGLADTRVGLPVRLTPNGVGDIVELDLRPDERAALAEAAQSIAKRISEMD